MKRLLLLMAVLLTLSVSAKPKIYKFKVKDGSGKEVSMKTFKGKVLLIVNTATQCGFTPQYTELEDLYGRYRDKGLEILDFPCNQFGEQAPGSYLDIHSFCTGNYNISFPQFDKVDVNGENASPLFIYLKEQQGFRSFGTDKRAEFMDQMMRKKDPLYDQNADVKWNFTKFLVDKKGRVVARFEPTQSMSEVEEVVRQLLK